MQTIKTTTYTPDHYFAAIKLIEQLYKDGKIPTFMYRNILKEHADKVDLSQFVPPCEKG